MTQTEQLLQRLTLDPPIAGLERHFAHFLLHQADQPGERLALAAVLVCRASAEGHVCLDLKRLAAPSSPAVLPAWRAELLQSGVVGEPGSYQPLILDSQDRLYLQRYWDYEQRLAKALLQRADQRVEGLDPARLQADLASWFPQQVEDEMDGQKLAAATALLRPFCVISGGPGTGKTTTVAKILLLLRQQPGGEALRIALAAPTGKAAARLQESIRHSKRNLSPPDELGDTLPEQATTLHRLLGVRQGASGFIHDRRNPLPLDVLILDEASMIDVALMTQLLEALPLGARLILLGDKDQLASVEAGAVLGDICGPCTGDAETVAAQLRAIAGEPPADAAQRQRGLCDAVVVLRHSYRFAGESPIGRLAAAVNGSDAQAVAALLAQQPERAIGWFQGKQLAEAAARRYLDLFHQVRAGASLAQLFQTLERFRVLCALRQGPEGAQALNRRIALGLQRLGVATDRPWYAGRPVMISRNDHQLRLYNGDIGITLPDPARGGALGVAFLGADRSVRWLAPARLPPHESVYAMTVHKSQGSEFDEVLLLLPRQDAPVLSRELLYTAITRARRRFFLAASPKVLESIVSRRLERHSGLMDLLYRS